MRASLLLLIVLALVGCASHPRPEPSQALPAENSPLVQRIEQLAAGHAAGQDFSEGGHIGAYTVEPLGATGAKAEAGDHFVKDELDLVAGGAFP